MRSRTRAYLLGGLASLGLLLAGCGSSNIKGALSSDQSSRISNELSDVSTAINNGSCGATRSALSQLDATLTGLPSATNPSLVSNLKQGAATLRGLAVKECHGTQTKTTTSSTSSTTSSTTPTTSSTPTTTATVTTTTTTSATTNSSSLPGTGTVTTLRSTPSSTTSTNGGGGLGQ